MGKKARPLPFSWIDLWKYASPSPDAGDAPTDDRGSRSDSGGLTKGVRLVLYALAFYMDEEGKGWPSIATLAADTGYSRSYVIRQLRQAEECGWLSVLQGAGPKGVGGRPNLYRTRVPSSDAQVTTPPESSDAQVTTPPGFSGSSDGPVTTRSTRGVIQVESSDAQDESSDAHVTRVVTPTSPERPSNAQLNVQSRKKGESPISELLNSWTHLEVPPDWTSPDGLEQSAGYLLPAIPGLELWARRRLEAAGIACKGFTPGDVKLLPGDDRRRLFYILRDTYEEQVSKTAEGKAAEKKKLAMMQKAEIP